MVESRGQMEDRLKAEGRWEAFEARRKELEPGGMTESDAYQQAVGEFAEPAVQRDEQAALAELAEAGHRYRCNLLKSLRWAAEHAAVPPSKINSKTVPSSEAITFLRMARDPHCASEWARLMAKLVRIELDKQRERMKRKRSRW